jgi:hypothetical protein
MAELALDAVKTVAVQHPGGMMEIDYKNYAKVRPGARLEACLDARCASLTLLRLVLWGGREGGVG